MQVFGKSHVETRNHHHHHSMNFETPPAPTTKFLLPSKFSSNSCDKDKNENPLQVCKRKYFRFYNAHAHDKSSEVISYHIHWMIQQSKCDKYVPQRWVEFKDELSWLFTKVFRAFYLICRKFTFKCFKWHNFGWSFPLITSASTAELYLNDICW